MKQFTFAIFLFSLITSSSQAQRGWRLFSGMAGTRPVHAIHESRDATLWVGGEGGFHGLLKLLLQACIQIMSKQEAITALSVGSFHPPLWPVGFSPTHRSSASSAAGW